MMNRGQEAPAFLVPLAKVLHRAHRIHTCRRRSRQAGDGLPSDAVWGRSRSEDIRSAAAGVEWNDPTDSVPFDRSGNGSVSVAMNRETTMFTRTGQLHLRPYRMRCAGAGGAVQDADRKLTLTRRFGSLK